MKTESWGSESAIEIFQWFENQRSTTMVRDCIRSAFMLGAGRVIAIDKVPERLQMAREGGAETLNFDEVDILDALREMTGNHGPDSCMDAVGMEAWGHGVQFMYDRAKQKMRMAQDRVIVLR